MLPRMVATEIKEKKMRRIYINKNFITIKRKLNSFQNKLNVKLKKREGTASDDGRDGLTGIFLIKKMRIGITLTPSTRLSSKSVVFFSLLFVLVFIFMNIRKRNY